MTTVERTLAELLDRSFDCPCGRTHRVPTRLVAVEAGVLERAPALLEGLVTGERALVVADARTIRNRFTVLDVAAELGLLDLFVDGYVCRERAG
jgi:hypothetical protein